MSGPLRLRAEGVHWRRVGEDIVILDGRTSAYLQVNATGAALWPLLAEGATQAELERRLAETFAVDERRAAQDVAAFVAELSAQGLLE